jgi:murein DD-endopeptidase MepM/ murein hydrolase activator NlpD
MRRYRLSSRSGRIGPRTESRYERIVIFGMITAAILLAFLDSTPSITRSSAWAISHRFGSTDLALTSFLRHAGQASASRSLEELPGIRRASSAAWGGRAADLDFRRLSRNEGSAQYTGAGVGSHEEMHGAEGDLAPSRITSGFGFRRLGGSVRHHDGIDIAMPYGTPIRAHSAGVVTFSGWQGGYGQLVVVDHGNGKETLYAHASALRARVGDRVDQGDVIGYVGATGRAFGSHLHFEIRYGGVPVDPEQEYLSNELNPA